MLNRYFCGYSLIFCLILGLNIYVSSEVATVVALSFVIYAMASSGVGIDRSAAKVIYPFILLEAVGLCLSFGNSFDYITKDAWYNAKIVLYIQLGYIIGCCVKNINSIFLGVIGYSVVIVSVYLYNLLLMGGLSDYSSAYDAGRIEIMVAMSLPLLICRDLGLKGAVKNFIAVLLFIGIVFSYSRTLIGCTLVLVFALVGAFSSWSKVIKLVAGAIVFALVVVLVRQMIFFDAVSVESEGFLGKVFNSFSEVAFVDQSDYESIMKNWRGFEAFNANEKFWSNSLFSQFFGNGFGSTVDLGIDIEFEDRVNMRYISHLHNGYYYVVLKFGLFGLLVYLLAISNIIKEFSFDGLISECVFLKNFAIGLALVFIYTTLVITGVYNKSSLDPYVIVLGVMFGWRVRFMDLIHA